MIICTVIDSKFNIYLSYILCACRISIGTLPGELSAKAIAMSFWHHEVEEELTSLGVREKWTFCKEAGDLSGTYDTAMEMVDKIRCEQLYSHTCTGHCKSKGW